MNYGLFAVLCAAGAWSAIGVPAHAQTSSVLERNSVTPTAALRPFASLLSTAIWKNKNIQVCWDNPTASNELGRKLTQQAVAETWEAVSGIRFVGWGTCPERQRGIRITVLDSEIDSLSPRTMGLGTQMERENDSVRAYAAGNMLLNFTFKKWNADFCDSDQNRNACIRSLAIHEFGHAIGFAHEQNRDDNLGQCGILTGDQKGNVNVGPFDTNSVMNYCKALYVPDLQLSTLDIQGVRKFYGDETTKSPQ